jgi:hypothetical protein
MRQSGLLAVGLIFALAACQDPAPGVDEPIVAPPVSRPSLQEDPSPVSARYLASVRAELGPSDRAGLWLQSSHVTEPAQGWIADLETGRSVRLLLLPQDAEDVDRHLISVEAMAALGVNLPRILVLDVYRDVRALPQ